MRRRDFITLLTTATVWPRGAGAQKRTDELPRVGILTPAESDQTPIFEAFRQGLRELGYAEGRNIVLEFRFAHGDYAAIPRLAAELVNLPVDVILTDGGAAAVQAAMIATATIPIVMGTSGDPVGQGLVTSLARPDRNVTGFTLAATELSIKRLELLRTAFPDASVVGVLLNPQNSGSQTGFDAAVSAARSLGLAVTRIEAGNPEALRALRSETLDRSVPILVLPDAMFWNNRLDIVALTAAARVPALYPEREYVEQGGLMAYGPNVADNFHRAAGYVDRILRGAKPSDLPVQEPAKFDFIVNLKTARTLGLSLPPVLLARTDEVIE